MLATSRISQPPRPRGAAVLSSVLVRRMRPRSGPIEVDRDRVAAANHDADALARLRLVAAGDQRRERRRAARLGHETEGSPERLLCLSNGFVRDEHDALDETRRDCKGVL